VATRLAPIAGVWRALAPENIFLSAAFLEALEQSFSQTIRPLYLVFYHRGEPVGIAYLQWTHFRAADHLRWRGFFGIPVSWMNRLKALFGFRLLMVGNLLATGCHGYHFRAPLPASDSAPSLISGALKMLSRREPFRASVTGLKDLPQLAPQTARQWEKYGFHSFQFQPAMVVDVDPSWRGLEDYLSALSSKYRIRARRAFRKAGRIVTRKLTTDEMRRERATLHALYRQVADKAGFNLLYLPPEYWEILQQRLPEQFRLYGHYLGDRLVGFHTSIRNGSTLEAHYLGFDDEINRQTQLYLNILYQLIEEGIELGVRRLHLARTALEIKSSVGAHPHALCVLLRRRHPILNRLLPFLVKWAAPKIHWRPRRPFRKDGV